MGDIGEPRAEFEVLPTADLERAEQLMPERARPLPVPTEPESQPPAR